LGKQFARQFPLASGLNPVKQVVQVERVASQVWQFVKVHNSQRPVFGFSR
jgi:hypothetical protein